jgi:hypothetical protein
MERGKPPRNVREHEHYPMADSPDLIHQQSRHPLHLQRGDPSSVIHLSSDEEKEANEPRDDGRVQFIIIVMIMPNILVI